ncbi:hypothetical protein, partial [Streptomyces kanasensis]|uniref:hypothetical protein n=1 Tax=Streptomyces kanasensis TaxID=936756 RepID=UPI002FCD1BD3
DSSSPAPLSAARPPPWPHPGTTATSRSTATAPRRSTSATSPKVCSFYLAAFNFDGLQQVGYTIAPQPMKAGDPSVQGAITLSPTGTGHTDELSLPDGMYKLTWTFVGATGAGKTKVFQVDCPDGTDSTSEEETPRGAVGAGGGGMAEAPPEEGSAFGVGAALAAGLAGTAGLILVRRRRRADGAA